MKQAKYRYFVRDIPGDQAFQWCNETKIGKWIHIAKKRKHDWKNFKAIPDSCASCCNISKFPGIGYEEVSRAQFLIYMSDITSC